MEGQPPHTTILRVRESSSTGKPEVETRMNGSERSVQ